MPRLSIGGKKIKNKIKIIPVNVLLVKWTFVSLNGKPVMDEVVGGLKEEALELIINMF